MKAGWEIVKLDEVISFERGLTYAKGDEVAYSSVGVLRSNNVDLTTQSLNLDEIKYLREDFEVPPKKKVRKSSLLMCMSNGSKDHLGKVALIDRELDYAFGGFMGLLTPDEGKVFPKYLYYALASKSFKDYIHSLADGANINNLKYKDLAAFDILLPSLAEQQRIVVILDQEFAKIDALKANAEKSLQAAKDLYAEYLNSSLSFKDGWKTKTLDEVCSKITDGTHNSPPNTAQGEFKYITAKNIKPWGLDLTDITFVSADIHRDIFSRCNPCKGDVLYIKDGATTGIAILNPLEEEFSLLSSVALLKPLYTEITSKYLCYAMNSPKMYAFVRGKMDGAAITRITLKKIKEFPISFPPLEEQDNITACLDKLNEKCSALQDYYQKTLSLCDGLKQSLLRKAFNGEL